MLIKELNYYEKTFYRAIKATPETRRASLAHWEKVHAENKKNKRFDLVIFSAENIRAINAAIVISEYVDRVNTIFDYDGELCSFEFPEYETEIFSSIYSAAAFAEYNLTEMEKAGVNNETC